MFSGSVHISVRDMFAGLTLEHRLAFAVARIGMPAARARRHVWAEQVWSPSYCVVFCGGAALDAARV
jgi:hypothetical protein